MKLFPTLCAGLLLAAAPYGIAAVSDWPQVTTQAKPHAYWWWMGSAVDTNNLTKELVRFRDAGFGGVHIIPIYGAKGWESNYIPYLSPKWMEMLDYTVTEARRLGMEVDMTTGSGWCFGGPKVTDEEANAVMVSSQWSVVGGQRLAARVDRTRTQALMALGPNGRKVDLLGKIGADGAMDWVAPDGRWTVYAISQKPSGQKVKRAGPGGEGWMLNLAYPQAMTNYLRWMDEGLTNYQGAKPRAQYHDSYEYKLDWSPTLLDEFEKRRGYRLQDHLDVFITGKPADQAARVKCDYRETIADLLLENTERWVNWSHERGFITRNEAHGSPGNWLDLYAAADIPETEMFYQDRNKLISKFASSAAHVSGKNLVSAETGTWVAEHFTETLADMKYLLDDLFLSGVNHVFYHGACYSPDEAPWPGWVFYASYEMNSRNAVWRDVAALNAYATRVQSVLQSGQPDNDILLYWPIHDFWSNAEGTTRNLTVHARDWFEDQPIGKTAEKLWKEGFQFDYVSDQQLYESAVNPEIIRPARRHRRIIVVPDCPRMPLMTFSNLVAIAKSGFTVVFDGQMPSDVTGLGDLNRRRSELSNLLAELQVNTRTNGTTHWAEIDHGLIVSGTFERFHSVVGDGFRERLFDTPGLMCVRRTAPGGSYYFIANRGDTTVDGWVPLMAPMQKAVTIMDPMTGRIGLAESRHVSFETEVRLQLPPGASLVLQTFNMQTAEGPTLPLWANAGEATALAGTWQLKFVSGGPILPPPFSTDHLASWTELDDTNAQSFAGTALYSLKFDAPDRLKAELHAVQLDLGKVCQSARVRLNGTDYGTLFTPPFRVVLNNMKPTDNLLEVEVTSTSANRIRDLDRRGVQWQNFHDINFVNLNYKKFDASNWPLADSGLLGPVTLTPVQPIAATGSTRN